MNNKPFSQLFASIGSFFSFFLGRLNWISPPWVTYLRRHALKRPIMFWATTAGIIACALTASYGYYWYKNLPKPRLVTASISAPKITTFENDEPVFDTLTIDFGVKDSRGSFSPQSVAPLKQIGKEVTQGITVSPAIEGKWYWQSDSQLVFTPLKDWPAGQTYEIQFAKPVFTASAKMERLHYSF